jgi:hypothetical protein
MPTAGYSGRTLVQKLGVPPGVSMVALGAPPDYASLLGRLPPDVEIRSRLPASADFVHQFARRRANLKTAFPRLARALSDTGVLWISWPKKTSGVRTDLDENVVRDLGLEQGLVDVKVCAIDGVWSGLKFVRRVKNRGR